MPQNIDLAKLVGAATSPVALIIAASILLGNLTTRYNAASDRLRMFTGELRQEQNDDRRSKSVNHQAELFRRRINCILRAMNWNFSSVVCFILTVVLTAISVVFPEFKL